VDLKFGGFLTLVLVALAAGHSIAPKTASAHAANAKVRNRQMVGGPIIL